MSSLLESDTVTATAVIAMGTVKTCGNMWGWGQHVANDTGMGWGQGQGYIVRGSNGVKHLSPCHSLLFGCFFVKQF